MIDHHFIEYEVSKLNARPVIFFLTRLSFPPNFQFSFIVLCWIASMCISTQNSYIISLHYIISISITTPSSLMCRVFEKVLLFWRLESTHAFSALHEDIFLDKKRQRHNDLAQHPVRSWPPTWYFIFLSSYISSPALSYGSEQFERRKVIWAYI